MSRLTVTPLELPGLARVARQRHADERGFLSRLFCAEELAVAGWRWPIAQINHTLTLRRGTVRGLHYQRAPQPDAKLVSCLRGEVWDVAVDLRAGSPTFLHWQAERLSAANGYALLIPQGFAHGFQALSDDTELLYCHAAAYNSALDAGLNPLDPRLAIDWPLPVALLSARDAAHALITPDFEGEHL
ncbi:dTDP-4-dehydrorhamnose 3,5-epimerase family protein [Rhodoferax sp.]|uniref:dTDP-4-dehydrorhamnose 3,5-epimerase family protein n=1 Tax=Rhodoferax sp. TaxID=50421 RepID=UPI00261164D6|nr:dTDP-4-dehydrorhamnose 3,5-epimerase family protein [Rhodoferax sp.]MDD2925665.1 dTDP-4-dehydrorhamnose 3,5-epimerase family protein [Rhodoferax sp.]